LSPAEEVIDAGQKALKTFIGDGTTVWVTREKADSEDPEIVPFEPK